MIIMHKPKEKKNNPPTAWEHESSGGRVPWRQGSPPPPLSPILYTVYTEGVADLNSNGLRGVLTLAYDGLIHKTASDINTAVTTV